MFHVLEFRMILAKETNFCDSETRIMFVRAGKTVDKSITNIELPAVSYNVAEVETLDCNENQC